MNQMEHDYAQLQTGAWALNSPRLCPCRGGGWFLSDLDTYHCCPIHGAGAPNPEYDGERYDGEDYGDYADWALQRDKRVYLALAHQAYRLGFKGRPVTLNHAAFEAANALGLLREDIDKRAALIEGLEAVVGELFRTRQEAQARRGGYSCALEMRLSWEAQREASERRGNGYMQ